MSVLITRSTDCSVFGGYSMKIQAEGGPSATSLAKVNFIDLRGLSKVCISTYIRMHLRNAGTFYARITPYYEDHMPMTPIDWTVLTQSGETQFTRYWRSFDMSKLGDAGELPSGTVFIKLSFGWDGALASGTVYVDAVKVEQGSFPTHWTPYGLKEQDSLDLVSDGETYRRVKEVTPTGEITPGSIQDGAVLQPKLADGAVGTTKIADGSVNLVTKVTGELPNTNLARIDLPSKIADGILPETKLDTNAQGKLAALRTDGRVKGNLVQEDIHAPGGIRTLIDTTTGKVTADLLASDGTASDKAGKLSGVTIAALFEGTQYRVEAAIPWTVFGISPAKGMRMGFAFSVSDDDASGTAQQDSMVSSAAARNLANPTTWGEITLK